jgi:hypothetical protein
MLLPAMYQTAGALSSIGDELQKSAFLFPGRTDERTNVGDGLQSASGGAIVDIRLQRMIYSRPVFYDRL